MRRSIRARLMVWVLALLLPLSAAGAWLLVQVFANRLAHDIDVALEEEAETVAEMVARPGNSGAVSALIAEIAGESDLGGRKYITVVHEERLVAAAPADAQSVLASARPDLRVFRYQIRGPEGSVVVSVGTAATGALHAKRRLTSLLAIGTPLVFLIIGSGLWIVIGRALRPLEDASRQIDTIAAENLSVRVPVENPKDEVGRMVTVLNRMLDRLDRAVAELRRFTADAAHELRTPLTVLRTGLEVALARERSAPEYRAALSEALTGTDRMCRLAEDLLTLARLDAAEAPQTAGAVDLGEMLHELGDAWLDTCEQRRIAMAVSADTGLQVEGNAGDLYRLFSNLIDNAVRHGREGGRLELAAQRAGDAVEVSVSDDGPGIAPADLPHIFDRFYRGKREAQDQGGTGLGLSIAQEIVRTHGGQITAGNRDSGGCIVRVILPAVGRDRQSQSSERSR